MRSIAKEQRWWKTRTGFWTRQSRWLDGVLAVAVGPVAPAFADRTRRVECPRSIAEYAERYISPQSQQASELVAQEARELVGRVEMLLELLDAAQSRNQEGAQREIALAAAISERCGRGAAVLAAPALTPAVPRSLRLQRGGGGLCSRRAVAGAGARVQGAPGRSREAAAAGGRRRHRGRGGWTGLAPLSPHTDFPLPPHRTAPCASGTPRNPPGLAARAGDEPAPRAATGVRQFHPDASAASPRPRLPWTSPQHRRGFSSETQPQCPAPSPTTRAGSAHGPGAPISGPMWADESQDVVWGLPGGAGQGNKGAWDHGAVGLVDLTSARPARGQDRSSARVDDRMRHRLAVAMAEVEGAALGMGTDSGGATTWGGGTNGRGAAV